MTHTAICVDVTEYSSTCCRHNTFTIGGGKHEEWVYLERFAHRIPRKPSGSDINNASTHKTKQRSVWMLETCSFSTCCDYNLNAVA